jgi:hypothetical protein
VSFAASPDLTAELETTLAVTLHRLCSTSNRRQCQFPSTANQRRHALVDAERNVVTSAVKDALIILPCSGRKAVGGSSARGHSVLELLGPALRSRLAEARKSVGVKAGLDESCLLSAHQRYTGTLYVTARTRIANAVAERIPMLILSGGYGLVRADEPIGRYDRPFSLSDWPTQLLEECLVAVATALRHRRVVAFCARTTGYADLIRRTSWSGSGIETSLVSPDLGARGGAQVLVPQASAQALAAFLDGDLHNRWVTPGGVRVLVEHLGK